MLSWVARVIKIKQLSKRVNKVSPRLDLVENIEIYSITSYIIIITKTGPGRQEEIWGHHFIDVEPGPDIHRRLEGAVCTNKRWEYKLPSRPAAASRLKAFHISEDFLFNPNMFRMSVSTGQLDIGIQDAEFKNESDKRKSKKKRTFPSASQLLSRYDGRTSY